MRGEHWLYTVPLRLRSLFRRGRVEQDLSDELQFHVEQRTAHNVAGGMTPEAGRLEAMCAMQGLEQSKEACRDTRGLRLVENFGRDVRYGLRMLRRTPGFTAVAVLSLALGIGANTAIFSLLNTLLLRPLPVPHPEQLRSVVLGTKASAHDQAPLPYPMFEELERRNGVFSSLFAWSGAQFQMRSGSEIIHIDGAMASGGYFETLGVPPLLGRTFTRTADHVGGGKDGPVAVISYRFWGEHFHRAPEAIGSSLELDRIRFTVIGVMPPEFFGAEVGVHPAVWVPLSFANQIENEDSLGCRSCWWLLVMGRTKAGLTPAQIDAGMRVVSPTVLRETLPPGMPSSARQSYMENSLLARNGANGWSILRLQFVHPLAVLMTLVGLVLLIACANLANLLLARASARNREIAVRLSLGADRPRIVRQLLTESVLLSLLGGVVGIAFAWWLTRLLLAYLVSQMGARHTFELDLHPDWRVALFTLLVAGGSGLLFGLAPALRGTRAGISGALKESTHNLRRDRRSVFTRLLLPLQAALSVILVAAAGLFAGSLFRLLHTASGFNPRDVEVISLDTAKRPEKPDARAQLYARMLSGMGAIPGVRAASLLWSVPLSGMMWNYPIDTANSKSLSEADRVVWLNMIGPGYIDVMEIPLLAGRQFKESDSPHAERVGLMNELAARRFFPAGDAVGQVIRLQKQQLRIVGVVGNVKYRSLRDPDEGELYLPYSQQAGGPSTNLNLVLKTGPGPSVYPEVRRVIHDLAPDVPIGAPDRMEKQVSDSISQERLLAALSLFFGGLALLLTAVGLYGALAYDVSRRTGEIGLRLALGARMFDIMWLIVRESTLLIVCGISTGIVTTAFLSKLVESLLFGIHSNDKANLFAAIAVLLAVGFAASLIPALRAARLDPTVSLRNE